MAVTVDNEVYWWGSHGDRVPEVAEPRLLQALVGTRITRVRLEKTKDAVGATNAAHSHSCVLVHSLAQVAIGPSQCVAWTGALPTLHRAPVPFSPQPTNQVFTACAKLLEQLLEAGALSPVLQETSLVALLAILERAFQVCTGLASQFPPHFCFWLPLLSRLRSPTKPVARWMLSFFVGYGNHCCNWPRRPGCKTVLSQHPRSFGVDIGWLYEFHDFLNALILFIASFRAGHCWMCRTRTGTSCWRR